MTWAVVLALMLGGLAWCTAAGAALRHVSRIWLRHWVELRLRGTEGAEAYLERPQRLLMAASAGAALAIFGIGLVVGHRAGSTPALAWGIAIAAAAALCFGQALPRAVARRWPTQLIPALLPVLRALDLVAAPLSRATEATVRRARHGRGVAPAAREPEGLATLLREGAMEGVSEREEIAIIAGVVTFGAKTLASVMTPRTDMFALPSTLPWSELARRVAASGYSRVPVYGSSLDDIEGMVHAFDVLKAARGESLRIRPVSFAPASRRCNELLGEMLRARRHMTIVRDDDGHTTGLVTLEDLLEELVGDIRDEHDEPEATRPPVHSPRP